MSTPQSTVGEVMTHAAVAVGREAPYKDVVRLMRTWKVSALPVLEGDGRVVGVVSEADLLWKQQAHGTASPAGEPGEETPKADGLLAGQLMSAPAVAVHADATVSEAARIMARRHVKRLPVIGSDGLLAGVVSRGDLLKVFLRSDEEIAEEVRTAVLGAWDLPGTEASVKDGVVTLRGVLRDRRLVPLLARAAGAVEGVVDVDIEVDAPVQAPA